MTVRKRKLFAVFVTTLVSQPEADRDAPESDAELNDALEPVPALS
jgi:hypothetical protein